jgi:hypothetical protein
MPAAAPETATIPIGSIAEVNGPIVVIACAAGARISMEEDILKRLRQPGRAQMG